MNPCWPSLGLSIFQTTFHRNFIDFILVFQARRIFVPSDHGMKNLVQEVGSCEMEDLRVLALGKLYYDLGL